MRRFHPRGEGRIGCILWLLVLLAFALVCWRAIPIKIASVELKDFMEDQARVAERSSPDQIRNRIVKRAEELQLPLIKKNVKVQKRGGRVIMECTYTVPLDLVVHTYNWKFNQIVNRPVFVF